MCIKLYGEHFAIGYSRIISSSHFAHLTKSIPLLFSKQADIINKHCCKETQKM